MDNSQTNLIVNYLPQTLTDAQFYSVFRDIGELKSYKIVRDKWTNYSYGFGFVDYMSADDAKKAIDMLNGLKIQNKTIKVAYSRPAGESSKSGNLYVRNVPKTMSDEQFEELFKPYGTVVNTRLLREANGELKGIGFCLYAKPEEAQAAIMNLNNKILVQNLPALSVKLAEDHSTKNKPFAAPKGPQMFGDPRYPGAGPMRNAQGRHRYNPMGGGYGQDMGLGPEDTTLFVYNIGLDTNEKALWALFSTYGTVTKVNVMYDFEKGNNTTKNYGFVTMSNTDEAAMAMECLNGYNFKGKPLSVSIRKDNKAGDASAAMNQRGRGRGKVPIRGMNNFDAHAGGYGYYDPYGSYA